MKKGYFGLLASPFLAATVSIGPATAEDSLPSAYYLAPPSAVCETCAAEALQRGSRQIERRSTGGATPRMETSSAPKREPAKSWRDDTKLMDSSWAAWPSLTDF